MAGRECVLGGHAWWGCVWQGGHRWQGDVHGREVGVGACMAEETATAADGTHPTGIHSCALKVLHWIHMACITNTGRCTDQLFMPRSCV